MYTVERYHDISCGHRVVGHESKCRFLHGHNYRIHFVCIAKSGLDEIGRVIDFGDIKKRLCQWLEDHWDHRFLLWDADIEMNSMDQVLDKGFGLLRVPFNPTAEKMAQYLVEIVGPLQLAGTGIVLHQVRIEETRKCSATYTRNQDD